MTSSVAASLSWLAEDQGVLTGRIRTFVRIQPVDDQAQAVDMVFSSCDQCKVSSHILFILCLIIDNSFPRNLLYECNFIVGQLPILIHSFH